MEQFRLLYCHDVYKANYLTMFDHDFKQMSPFKDALYNPLYKLLGNTNFVKYM